MDVQDVASPPAQKVSLETLMLMRALLAGAQPLEFGDVAGHLFHGNQWDRTPAERLDNAIASLMTTTLKSVTIHTRGGVAHLSNPRPTNEPDTDGQELYDELAQSGETTLVRDGVKVDAEIHHMDDEPRERGHEAWIKQPVAASILQPLEFTGDVEGHPFHGNQWTGGTGEAERSAERARVKERIDAAFKAGLSTEDQFDKGKFGAPGAWSPDREAMHQQIVDRLMTNAAKVPNDAEAIIMGGLMGAGKSTIIGDERSAIDAENYLTINPDQIKDIMIEEGMTPEIDGLNPMQEAGLIHEESSKIAYDLADQAQAIGKNVLWDISMSSPGSVGVRVKELTDDLGPRYNVKMVFVDIPIETALTRANDRYENGGRFMDPDLLNSFADDAWGSKNRAAFEAVKDQADEWQLWDNSRDFDPRLTAASFNMSASAEEAT